MTKKERKDPDLLNKSRISRIAKGSGTKDENVRDLLKNFKKTKKMMQKFKGGKLPAQMKKFAKQYKAQGIDLSKMGLT